MQKSLNSPSNNKFHTWQRQNISNGHVRYPHHVYIQYMCIWNAGFCMDWMTNLVHLLQNPRCAQQGEKCRSQQSPNTKPFPATVHCLRMSQMQTSEGSVGCYKKQRKTLVNNVIIRCQTIVNGTFYLRQKYFYTSNLQQWQEQYCPSCSWYPKTRRPLTFYNVVPWSLFLFLPHDWNSIIRDLSFCFKQISHCLCTAFIICLQIVMRSRIYQPQIVSNTVPSPDNVPTHYLLPLLIQVSVFDISKVQWITNQGKVWTTRSRKFNLNFHTIGSSVVLIVTQNLFSLLVDGTFCRQ